MTRSRRAVVVPALVVSAVVALGGCAGRAGSATATPTSTGPADPAVIAARVRPAGIAPELVYVTDVAGFDVATQSVGVVGDDGMSAIYVRLGGDATGTVVLTTGRTADPSAVPCADLPDSAGSVLRCGVQRGDAPVVHVLLEGHGADAATLRAAGEAVRVPRADELDALFVDLPTPGAPVERGDLPPFGEGAPVDPPAQGG